MISLFILFTLYDKLSDYKICYTLLFLVTDCLMMISLTLSLYVSRASKKSPSMINIHLCQHGKLGHIALSKSLFEFHVYFPLLLHVTSLCFNIELHICILYSTKRIQVFHSVHSCGFAKVIPYLSKGPSALFLLIIVIQLYHYPHVIHSMWFSLFSILCI